MNKLELSWPRTYQLESRTSQGLLITSQNKGPEHSTHLLNSKHSFAFVIFWQILAQEAWDHGLCWRFSPSNCLHHSPSKNMAAPQFKQQGAFLIVELVSEASRVTNHGQFTMYPCVIFNCSGPLISKFISESLSLCESKP